MWFRLPYFPERVYEKLDRFHPAVRLPSPGMAETHLTIRRRPDDPFDELADKLETNVADSVRSCSLAVLRSPVLLEQIRAELAVGAFITRLQRNHPRLASLRFNIPARGSDEDFDFVIANRGKAQTEQINWRELDPSLREADGGWTLDLVDPTTAYGLIGAWHRPGWDPVTADVPLRALHVPRPLTGPPVAEVALGDGRRAVESRDVEGVLHRYALDETGNARLLPPAQRVARAYKVEA